MVEMVCLHVISLMEALQECNSTIFVKVRLHFWASIAPFEVTLSLLILIFVFQLIPMWLPMIQSNLKVNLLRNK